MTEDYSHLIGKFVRTAGFQPRDTIRGTLESWKRIEGSDCISVWLRRRSGTPVLITGRFELERVPR